MRLHLLPSILLVSSCVSAAGCGGGPVREDVATADRPDDPLDSRMAEIGALLGDLGYRTASWSHRGELGAGGEQIARLSTPKSGRVVLVAIGDAAGANLNLTVTGPQGAIEAEDVASDVRAAVELATAQGTVYEVAIANASVAVATRYLVQAFSALPSTEPAPLFGLFDADPAGAPSWDDVEQRVASLGVDEPVMSRTVSAGRGVKLSERIRLEGGTCYMFAAQGSAGIDGVAIRITEGESLVVADLSQRRTAWARHCAEEDGEIKMTVEVIAGSGQLRIAAFSATRADLDPAWVGPPLRPHAPPPTVDAAIRWTDQQLARAGYDPAEIQLEGEIAAGERLSRWVSLADEECVVFSALSGDGVRDLDLEVEAESGKLVAADSTLGPSALVRFCARSRGEYRVSVVGHGGHGTTVMMISRLPRIELPIEQEQPPRDMREAAAVFRHHGLVPLDRIAPMIRDGESKNVWSAQVELEQGRCYGVGAAVDGARVEVLELIGPSGASAAKWKRDGLPATLTTCVEEGGEHRVRVLLGPGAGESPPLVLLFGSGSAPFTRIGTP
jgi:hypothetical protein